MTFRYLADPLLIYRVEHNQGTNTEEKVLWITTFRSFIFNCFWAKHLQILYRLTAVKPKTATLHQNLTCSNKWLVVKGDKNLKLIMILPVCNEHDTVNSFGGIALLLGPSRFILQGFHLCEGHHGLQDLKCDSYTFQWFAVISNLLNSVS